MLKFNPWILLLSSIAGISIMVRPVQALEEFAWSRYPTSLQIKIKAALANATQAESQQDYASRLRVLTYQAMQRERIRESFLDDEALKILEDCIPDDCSDITVFVSATLAGNGNNPSVLAGKIKENYPGLSHGFFRIPKQSIYEKSKRTVYLAPDPIVSIMFVRPSDAEALLSIFELKFKEPATQE